MPILYIKNQFWSGMEYVSQSYLLTGFLHSCNTQYEEDYFIIAVY